MKLNDTENLEEMARLFMNGNTREMELEGFEVVPDYYEEKRPPRIRKSEESFDDEDEYEDEFEEEMTIVRRKQVELSPMVAEEAVLQMEMLGHDFFVFLDMDTNDVSVVYKRKGNAYGLIETKR